MAPTHRPRRAGALALPLVALATASCFAPDYTVAQHQHLQRRHQQLQRILRRR